MRKKYCIIQSTCPCYVKDDDRFDPRNGERVLDSGLTQKEASARLLRYFSDAAGEDVPNWREALKGVGEYRWGYQRTLDVEPKCDDGTRRITIGNFFLDIELEGVRWCGMVYDLVMDRVTAIVRRNEAGEWLYSEYLVAKWTLYKMPIGTYKEESLDSDAGRLMSERFSEWDMVDRKQIWSIEYRDDIFYILTYLPR